MDYSFLGANSYSYTGGIGPLQAAYTEEPELNNSVEDSQVGRFARGIYPRT